MKTIRNISFSAIAALACLLPIGNLLAGALIPDYECATQSILEARLYQEFPDASAEAMQTGQFQSEMDQFVSDKIPHKDGVLLKNASVQRSVIELANSCFGFSAYPTFFGSDFAHSTTWHAIVPTASKRSTIVTTMLNDSADKLNQLVKRYPEKQWVMALTDQATVSEASPTHDLVSNPADYSYYVEEYLDKLDSCRWVDVSHRDTSSYYEDYFKTDHHWQVQGAVKGYQSLAKLLGLQPYSYEFKKAYKGAFFGSHARNGLITYEHDYVDDIVDDFGASLTVELDGQPKKAGYLDSSYAEGYTGYKKSSRFENVYGVYFHNNKPFTTITNPSPDLSKTLLIVGDSFANNMERMLARHYAKVYVIDLRSYPGTADEFLSQHEVDDVAFIWSPNGMLIVADKLIAD